MEIILEERNLDFIITKLNDYNRITTPAQSSSKNETVSLRIDTI